MEQKIDICYYRALRALRRKQNCWFMLQLVWVLTTSVLSILIYRGSPAQSSLMNVLTLLALGVGWVFVIKDFVKVQHYSNFEFAIQVAVILNHSICAAVNSPTATLDERLHTTYNVQILNSDLLTLQQKRVEQRCLRNTIEKVYLSHCRGITILTYLFQVARLALFMVFLVMLRRCEVEPSISQTIILYCIVEIVFISKWVAALLTCTLSPCLIPCFVCLMCCCSSAIAKGNGQFSSTSTQMDTLVYLPSTQTDSNSECQICLEQFNIGTSFTKLPCNIKHKFHEDCFKSWLVVSRTCPTCRALVS